jgi:hypothetical protein
MIHLQFPEATAKVENWRERLGNLIVAFKAEQQSDFEHPVITEGKKQYIGADAIEKFLKELEKDINDWRTPRCGV